MAHRLMTINGIITDNPFSIETTNKGLLFAQSFLRFTENVSLLVFDFITNDDVTTLICFRAAAMMYHTRKDALESRIGAAIGMHSSMK